MKLHAKVLVLCALFANLAMGQARPLLAGERDANVTAIPNVVAAGAQWEIVWADFVTADGMVATADGGVMFAQEQTDKIIKLDPMHKQQTVIENTNGAGAISVDAKGQIYAVQRTCTEPLNAELAGCNELTAVSILYPARRVLANTFANGTPMGRLNDIIADGKGGAYFTVGGAFYVNPEGVVSTVEDKNIRSNGIMLSPDGRTLFVTNNTEVLAFQVKPDGTTQNRRVFGTLKDDDGGDGMAVDAGGRLYVTGNKGVHVFAPAGAYLGMIPTPRRPITLTFSGPDKKTLYIAATGAVGPDGKAWATPEGIRNTGMTIYRIPMVAQGIMTRAK